MESIKKKKRIILRPNRRRKNFFFTKAQGRENAEILKIEINARSVEKKDSEKQRKRNVANNEF